MAALPDTIDDPKVQELMSHYFATSNHDSDHEGFADMFTADGEYSMNDRKAKGRQGSKIPTLLPIQSKPFLIPITILLPPFPRLLHASWQSNVPYALRCSTVLKRAHWDKWLLMPPPVEIIDMRRGLWSHIPTRDHNHMGHETDTEWAAYYELEKDENGMPKFQKIHIITVSNVVLCFRCGAMGLTGVREFLGL